MNTDQQTPHIQKASRLYSKLNAAWRSSRVRFFATSIFMFAGIFLSGLLVLHLINTEVYLSAVIKTNAALFAGLLALFISYSFYKFYPVKSFSHFLKTAAGTYASGQKELLAAIDLYSNQKHRESVFYDAALKANTQAVDEDNFDNKLKSYQRSGFHFKVFIGSAALLLISVLTLVFSGTQNPDALNRTVQLWAEFEKPNPYQYTITPGNSTVEQGAVVKPNIEFTDGNHPDAVTLAFKTGVEENFRERPMTYRDGRFSSAEIELTNSITYKVMMDQFSSEEYTIEVRIQPRFENYTAKIHPPSYTGLSVTESEYPFSELSFYRGSEIEFHAETNKPISQLELLKNGEPLSVEPADTSLTNFAYRFTPEQSDTLRFRMTDDDGLQNRNPFRTVLNILDDERPVVTIRQPTGTVMESEPRAVDIIYRATDDFGLTRAVLHWEKVRAYVDQPITGSMQIDTPRNGQTERFNWDLGEKELRPRDKLQFWIRVRDNDDVSGMKWGESQRVTIQVPSLAEFFEELDERERDVGSELDNISDSFEQMQEEYERFIERLRENPQGGFEEQELLESVTEQQKEIDETVNQLREQFEQLRNEMQESQSVSEETRNAYNELQQLMDELDDPAFREALEEMRRAMENMRPEEIERALENVSFNEELYRERLERTKELFKQLKMNSDLDKLANQYEDLASRIEQRDDQGIDQLQHEMDTIEEDLDSISNQLNNLDSNPPKRSEEALRQLKEESQERLKQMQEQLEQLKQEAAEQSEGGASEPSESMQQQQQQLGQQMQQEADRLRSSMQQMGGEQMQVNLLALQRALYTLLELSDEQENLTRDAIETRTRSQGYVELARRQNYVKSQFSAVADTIFQISAEIPGVPNQVNRKKAEVERVLNRSISEMADRNQRGATITTRESLGGINELSSTIASLIDQLMDQSGEGGGGMSMQQMIDQMQNMSGDQQQLNQQLQDLVNDMQGERLTREQSERLDQLARQQNEIRRQMQELQRSGALRDGDRAMSELQRMIEGMEDSINDMRGGMTDPLMIERQQNILSRMLDAEESFQQRGETEEREGTRPDRFDEELPPDMTLEELQQEIRNRLQDPNYTRFSERYERLIQRYFEYLRQLDEDELLP